MSRTTTAKNVNFPGLGLFDFFGLLPSDLIHNQVIPREKPWDLNCPDIFARFTGLCSLIWIMLLVCI